MLILLQTQKRVVITGWNDGTWEKSSYFVHLPLKKPPSSNLAEGIHAGWKHRERMGVRLFEACLFDTRDTLIFESQIEDLATGSFPGGDGSC